MAEITTADVLIEEHREGRHMRRPPWSRWIPLVVSGHPDCPFCDAGHVSYLAGEHFAVHQSEDFVPEQRHWVVQSRLGKVTVSSDLELGSLTTGPARVHWSGMMPQLPDDAELYARQIRIGAEIARELDAAAREERS